MVKFEFITKIADFDWGKVTLPNIKRAIEVSNQRKLLSELDDDALRDIGISAAKRDQECARPFWDFD